MSLDPSGSGVIPAASSTRSSLTSDEADATDGGAKDEKHQRQPTPTSISALIDHLTKGNAAAQKLAHQHLQHQTSPDLTRPPSSTRSSGAPPLDRLPTSTALAMARRKKKRETMAEEEEAERREMNMELLAGILPQSYLEPAVPATESDEAPSVRQRKARRNASFIASAFNMAPTAATPSKPGSTDSPTPVASGFDGGYSNHRGVKFYEREKVVSSRRERIAAEEKEREMRNPAPIEEEKSAAAASNSASSSPVSDARKSYRSKRFTLADAIDPLAIPLAGSIHRPTLSTSMGTVRDERLRAEIESQQEEEENQKRKTMTGGVPDFSMTDSARTSPSKLKPTLQTKPSTTRMFSFHDRPTTAPMVHSSQGRPQSPPAITSASSSIVLHPQALTTQELEQQVLDEWTSSSEDDLHVDEQFKAETLLSRTTRRKYGLRSMREVMNILSKPLAKREFPLQEYEQSGAFQAVAYWPTEGRFKHMHLSDTRPSHTNTRIADPKAPMTTADQLIPELKPHAPKPPARGTIAHARNVSIHRNLLSTQKAFKTTLDGIPMSDGFLDPTLEPVVDTPISHSPTNSSTTNELSQYLATPAVQSALSAEFTAAFSQLNFQTESEKLATVQREISHQKKSEAVKLFAAAQAAPFIQLRRDLEAHSTDAFVRFLASDRPLLTDAQIDALLADKIDESVRKGFPRNRAALRGLSSKGAISFGIPKPPPNSMLERQLEEMMSKAGGHANTIQTMFHEDRDSREAHKRRNLTHMNRPYSAISAKQRKELALIQSARTHTRELLHSNPPVGAYHPTYDATSADLHEPSVNMAAQAGRDLVLKHGAGLGVAQRMPATNLANLKRPSNEYGVDTGPGPADTLVTRLFDDNTNTHRKNRPGTVFSTADVGLRTCIMTAEGHPKPMLADATTVAFSSVQIHPRDYAAPEPFKPLHFSKVVSSIGTGPSANFCATLLPSRAADAKAAHEGVFVSTASQPTRQVLQYSGTQLIGPGAHLPHAPLPPAINFGPHTERGLEDDLSPRAEKIQRDRRAAAGKRLQARLAKKNAAARQAQEARREAKALKLEEEARRRDQAFFAKNEEKRLGVEGAKEKAALAKKKKEEKEALERKSSIASSTTSSQGNRQQKKPRAKVPTEPVSSSSEDSDSSLTHVQRASKAIRDRLGPMSNYTAEAKLARIRAQSALRRERHLKVQNAWSNREVTRATEVLEEKELHEKPSEQDKEAMALKLKDVQMIWLFLIANVARIQQYRARIRLNQSMFKLNLGHLNTRVAELVLAAKNAWRRLVSRNRRDRSARIIQGFFRRVRLAARRKRARLAAPVLVGFFEHLGQRTRIKALIWNFKGKIVRIQRWWRKTLRILRARRELLERLWIRTLQVRWEELLKYRLYLTHIIDHAAAGGYTSVLGHRVTIPQHELQRFSNLAVVWRANDEEANAASVLQHPPTISGSTTSFHPSPNAAVENIWERFVWLLFQRNPPEPQSSAPSKGGVISPTSSPSRHAKRPSKFSIGGGAPGLGTGGMPSALKTPTKHYPEAHLSNVVGSLLPQHQHQPSVSFREEVNLALTAPTSPIHVRRGLSLTPMSSTNLSVSPNLASPRAKQSTGGGVPPHTPPSASRPFSASVNAASSSSSSSSAATERAQMEFEAYLGLTRPAPMKESSFVSSSATSNTTTSQVDNMSVSINSPASLISTRRTALRNFYLRLRLLHRKLIYQARTFDSNIQTRKRSLSPNTPTSDALPVRSRSRNESFDWGASSAGGGGRLIHDLSITGEIETGFYSLERGLPIYRSSKWLHLLNFTSLQELLMECMIPRSLAQAAQNGLLVRTRMELLKHLRTHGEEKYMVLKHHPGWPYIQQQYGPPPPTRPMNVPLHVVHPSSGQLIPQMDAVDEASNDATLLSAHPPSGSRPSTAARHRRQHTRMTSIYSQGSIEEQSQSALAATTKDSNPAHKRRMSQRTKEMK